jgi:peptidoglycan/LPS O-acetylase OafA/YrhL
MSGETEQRIIELDGLRGTAVILVMIHHYFTGILPDGLPFWAGLARDVTAPFFLSGVDLFFVISGFIVGGIIIDNVGKPGFFRSFYIRRTTRIFPLYFGMLFLFLIANAVNAIWPNRMGLWLLKDNMPLWSYVVFMQNYFMAIDGQAGGKMFAMAWSVATEEHFYLMFPALLFFTGLRRTSAICMSLLIVCPIIRELAFAKWGFFAAYVPFPARADTIAYGVLIAMTIRAWPDALRSASVQRAFVALAILSALLVISYDTHVLHFGPGIRFSALAFFYACVLIVGVIGSGRLASILRSKTLVWFGFVSYALYMFHQTVNGLMHAFVLDQPPQMLTWTDFRVTSCSVAIAILAAWLSTKQYEARIRKWGYRITSDQPHAAIASSPATVQA